MLYSRWHVYPVAVSRCSRGVSSKVCLGFAFRVDWLLSLLFYSQQVDQPTTAFTSIAKAPAKQCSQGS